MTLCPGKKDPDALTGSWDRDLGIDLDAIRHWGARAVVTLLDDRELSMLKVTSLGNEVRKRGMAWFQLPIVDTSVPDDEFERSWHVAGPMIRAILNGGERVLVHCRGGLGRAGTIAAQILVELGEEPVAAMRRVRQARPHAIENSAQEAYVRRCRQSN
ncbi:MAG: cyclin-dependent kinase inhibitor 3 family protein [Vulcanimicrobiaceae bacterium]